MESRKGQGVWREQCTNRLSSQLRRMMLVYLRQKPKPFPFRPEKEGRRSRAAASPTVLTSRGHQATGMLIL